MCSHATCMSFSSKSAMRPSSPLSRWKLCSLTTCMSFSTKSAMRPFSPLSRWKLTVPAPPRHQSFSESLGPHIFRIFVREPTFMHRDEGRLYLNSEEAPRSSIETSATWELSKDSTWRPFSQQSKITSCAQQGCSGISMCSLPTCMSFSLKSAKRPSSPLSRWKLRSLTTCMSFSTKPAMRPFPPLSRWKLTVSAPPRHQSFSESLGSHIFRIFAKESTFMPSGSRPGRGAPAPSCTTAGGRGAPHGRGRPGAPGAARLGPTDKCSHRAEP
mmetsp:Transcript_110017/g.341283  ORF Transcript_110017/g.341283 Transcript_110017/m.341283 type:complete len:271 (-) Transcript_110017:2-814(-)